MPETFTLGPASVALALKSWKPLLVMGSAKKPSAAGGVKKDKIQTGLADGAIKAAQEGYPVFSVSSDVQGSTGISRRP